MPVRFLHKRRSKISICDTPVFLDCETSWNHDDDNPKCWIVSIQVWFDGHYHFFRKPEQLIDWYLEKIEQMKLSEDRVLITYIHNASYDLSYLAPYIQKFLPDKERRSGLYDGAHKIIYYKQGGLEFKCTYLLSGQSLEKWSNDMDVEHKKQVGLYDYDRIIYQDTEIDEASQIYDKYDVLAMQESFDKQLRAHEDNITTVPLTSTGYPRRELRNSCNDKDYLQKYFYDNRIDGHTLLFNLHSYAGGYTHNNRLLKSKVIKVSDLIEKYGKDVKIGHGDFRSHYPTQLRVSSMAWGKFSIYYHVTEHESYYKLHGHNINIDDICNMYPEYASITHIRFYHMTLKDNKITMPFMQYSKIIYSQKLVKDGDKWVEVPDQRARIHCDNGRVLAMVDNDEVSGYFDCYLDNRTLEIIKKQYNIKYKVIEVIRSKTSKIPKQVADVIDKFFKDKSDWKILHKKYQKLYGEFDERTLEAGFRLLLSKKQLNGLYGVFATFPLRPELDMDFTLSEPFHIVKEMNKCDYDAGLEEYYSHRSNFLHYPIGCETTSAARYELFQYIEAIGYENVLYCDTDSIFYIKTPEIQARVEALNAEKRKTAPYITDINGNKVYYDVFEEEEDLLAFKGLHSKCYGYVTEKEELKVVIAGVPERTVIGLNEDNKPIYLFREEELAGITKEQRLEDPERESYKIEDPYAALNNLSDNFRFKINSGVTAKYIVEEPHTEIINGHEISTAGGCIIRKLDDKMVHDWDFLDDVKVDFSDIDLSM